MRAIEIILAPLLCLGIAAAHADPPAPEEVKLDSPGDEVAPPKAGGQPQPAQVQPAAPLVQDQNQDQDDYGGSTLDEERARLRNELLMDRASDFKARSAQFSAGQSAQMRLDLQREARKRAEERGRVVLAERGEGSGEATEEAKEVGRWNQQHQLTDEERKRRAAAGRTVNERQGFNSMVNGMQAWASGKDISNARREKRGSGDEEEDAQ